MNTLTELGQVLRKLRRRQARVDGGKQLTYREIADRAGWSHGVVGEYFAGRVLPPTDRFDTLIMMLGATPAEQGALATVRDRLEEERRRPTPVAPAGGPPRELPSRQPVFTARAADLSRLDDLLAGGCPVVISGMAGVGKTSLALHWSHRVSDRFPDGQLYLNLRGFHPGRVMSAGEALRQLLGSLGVPGEQIPAEPGAAERLWRTTLHGRRVLVVLDNAADAEQVRPLLPPDGCLGVVTSRRQLTGLVVTDGATTLTLRPFGDGDARDLLAARLGADRIAGEGTAAGRIIAACGGLPLALAVVAARGVVNPDFPLADIAADLDRRAGCLDAMRTDDSGADVRAAFSWSYQALPAPAQRMFRLLGPYPGPDITVAVAAALAGTAPAVAQRELAALAGAQLLTEQRPGRYVFHDLVRAYATELAEEVDAPADRDAARDRLIMHFVHETHAAATALNPFRAPMELPAGDRPATSGAPDGEAAALAWFAAQRQALLAVFDLAARTSKDRAVWQLAWGMGEFLDREGDRRECASVQETALAAAGRIGDRAARAFSHRVVANGCLQVGRAGDAFAHLEQAHDLYRELDDLARAANCLYLLAWACGLQDRRSEALGHSERAIALARRAGDPAVLGFSLNMAGHLLAGLGEHERAVERCREAAGLQREIGHRVGLAATLDTLGVAYHGLGRFDLAVEHYREGIELHAELGDRHSEAEMAVRLGATHLAIGQTAAARAAWHRALGVFESLNLPEAPEVRERLAALPPDPGV